MSNIDVIARFAARVLPRGERLEYGFDAQTRPKPFFIADPMFRGIAFVRHRMLSEGYRVLVTDQRVIVTRVTSPPTVVASRPRSTELTVNDAGGRLALSGAWNEGELWVHGRHARAQARSAAGSGEVAPWHTLPEFRPARFGQRARAFVWNFLPPLLLFVAGAVVGGLLKGTSTAAHASIVTVTTIVAVSLGLLVVWRDATGQSGGKRRFGIRVVDRSTDRPIGPARGFVRLVGRAADVLSYGVGFLIVFRTERRQTFADLLAGSVVVEDPVDDTVGAGVLSSSDFGRPS